jgi:hypothetical protein
MFDDDMFDLPQQNNNKNNKKENEIMKLIINEIGKASEYIYLNTSMLYKISQIINNTYEEDGLETHVYYYDEDADGDNIDEFIENLKREMKKKRDELDE